MQRKPLDTKLLQVAQYCTILIPIACSVSRAAADVLLILPALLFLIHTAITRDTDWLKISWVRVALILWVYVVGLSFFAEDMGGSLKRSVLWIRFPVFAFAAAFWLFRDASIHRKLMISLSIAVGFMIIDTFIQYFTGSDLLGYTPIPSETGQRLTGSFSSPRIGIMLAWMSIPVVAYWLMSDGGATRRGRELLLGIFFTIGYITVIFMSGERMALLLSGLAFVIAFFMLPVSKKLMLGLGLTVALLIATTAYFNQSLVERHISSTSKVISKVSGSDYGKIWISAFEMFKQHPITGVGLRQFRVLCSQERYGSTEPDILASRCNQHTHNIYLEWLAESGIIGFTLFIFMLALMAKVILRAYPTLRTNPIFLGLVITMLIRLWPISASTSFFTAWYAVPFWLTLGWLLALAHSVKTEKTS